jgi:DNA processing protein
MDETVLSSDALVTLNESERFDWLRLLRCENVGPRTFQRLLKRHGNARSALEALPALIASGKPARPVRIPPTEEIEKEMAAAQAAGGRFIAICEPDYPALLRRTGSPPPLIAVRGNVASLKRSKVAIVGARNASAAGLAFAAQLARGIARAGHVIVSGLARGIDARAHQTAIETGTIAVLAGGLGNIYPPEHEALLEQIVEQGAAISEMPFGWAARGRDFPRRNRIVAGLCRAVVVVEAARRSGSLITAKFAAEEGREIFAVPGSPLDPRAEGTNDLLREGASICIKVEDIVEALAKQSLSSAQPHTGFFEFDFSAGSYEPLWEELDLEEVPGAPSAPAPFETFRISRPAGGDHLGEARQFAAQPVERHLTDVTARVADLLGPVPVSVDELARQAQAPVRQVRTALSELKLAGRVEWHSGDLVSSPPTSFARAGDVEE